MSPGLSLRSALRRTAAVGLILTATVGGAAIQASAATSAPATQTVAYAGHDFTGWTAVRP